MIENSLFICPLCSTPCTSNSRKYSLRDIFSSWSEYGTGYRFSSAALDEINMDQTTQLFLCGACDFGMFIPPCPGTDRFYQELSAMGESWYYLEDKWEYQQALLDIKGANRVLDIGCGRGAFLHHCQNMNVEAEGIELNSKAADFARSRGFNVHELYLDVFASDHVEEFDAVSLFQVLEHLDKPIKLMKDVIRCVKPGGRIIVTVPNMGGVVGRLSQCPANVPPHHISRWTHRTLAALGGVLGLTLNCVKYEPVYNLLPGYLENIYFHWLPQSVKNNLLWQQVIGLPTRILRTVKPNGLKTLPGHTVYVSYDKPLPG